MHYLLKSSAVICQSLCLLALLTACGGGGGGGSSTAPAGDGGAVSQPAPQSDAFGWTGNTRLDVQAAAGLLANDPPGTAIDSADQVTTLGGTVSVNLATGAFTYDPPAGLQNAVDSFGYTAGGVSATVTVTLTERIWFVNNSGAGAGAGTRLAPFPTLAEAEAASDENDTIFVFAGNRTDTGQDFGITLKDGQRLIGEGVGLRFNGVPIVDPVPEAVLSNAALTVPANAPVVRLATGNEVAGFILQAASDEAILATGGGDYDLHDNIISLDPGNGRDGIRLLNVTGVNTISRISISGAPRSGIKLANNENLAGDPVPATPVTATVNMIRNTINGSAGDGISVGLAGAGTLVTLNLLNNVIAGSGAGGADEGIDVDALGGASVTTLVSRNTVTGSSDEAIELTTADASSQFPFVANNSLSGNSGAFDFRAATSTPGTVICLELLNNGNAGGDTSFLADNGGGGTFGLFELLNDTLAARIDPVGNVAEGACGIPLGGAVLFEANCGHCHRGNGLGSGTVGPTVTGATAAQINFQIANNFSMGDINLTQREIAAISAALTGQ